MRDFDADPLLADLLKPAQQQQLLQHLQALTGALWQLHEQPQEGAAVVEFQLNELAWLSCSDAAVNTGAGAALLAFILGFVAKYRMAATVHIDATEVSYAELQRQHEALKVSEQRYRDLAASLQQQVEAQVASLQEAQQSLYDSARLRSVGQLAAGVAHEINNPIGFISGNLKVAREYLDELVAKIPAAEQDEFLQQDFRQLLEESASGARRIAAIVADLKTFANINQEPQQQCDINAVLATAARLIEAEYGQHLQIGRDLTELPRIKGYPARLSQALFNLLDNAARAVNGKGEVRMMTRPLAADAAGVQIIIEDNGPGLSDEVLACAFDPFFTTRDVGAGTGLGLTVARDVVLAHQGTIRLENRAEQGCRVIIQLMGSST